MHFAALCPVIAKLAIELPAVLSGGPEVFGGLPLAPRGFVVGRAKGGAHPSFSFVVRACRSQSLLRRPPRADSALPIRPRRRS
jgi:hypothetical protein